MTPRIFYIISLSSLLICGGVEAQSFLGGAGDGYSAASTISTDPDFFLGGSGDGHVISTLIESDPEFYKGGSDDGFTFGENFQSDPAYFVGGFADGSADAEQVQADPLFYSGGIGDGFDAQMYIYTAPCLVLEDNNWTGLGDGRSWNDSDNWFLDIPTPCHDVIINGSLDSVMIPANYQAVAHSVRVDGWLNLIFGADLNIDLENSTLESGLYGSGGDIENHGSIVIENASSGNTARGALRSNNGSIFNYGQINIQNVVGAASNAIYIQSGGAMYNDAAGSIHIRDVNNSLGYAIRNQNILHNAGLIELQNVLTIPGNAAVYNQANLTNTGSIKIDLVDHGIRNADTIINGGLIEILNSREDPAIRLNSSINDPFLHNLPNGVITISNSGYDAVDNVNGASILNDGMIQLANIGGRGIHNSQSTFINTGIIEIDTTSGDGIFSSNPFINSGSISIDSSGGHNIKTIFDGVFSNLGGDIAIQRPGSGMVGMIIEDSLYNAGNINITDISGPGLTINTTRKLINTGSLTIHSLGLLLDMDTIESSGVLNILGVTGSTQDFLLNVQLGSELIINNEMNVKRDP